MTTDDLPLPLPDFKPFRTWFNWTAAGTFLWAFLIDPVLLKQLSGVNEWIRLFAYPALCVIAAGCLLRTKRGGFIALAGLNVACAIAWIVFSLWATREFARHFWR